MGRRFLDSFEAGFLTCLEPVLKLLLAGFRNHFLSSPDAFTPPSHAHRDATAVAELAGGHARQGHGGLEVA
eukprot:6186028-Pleurochrysis_carterae.AAC.1